MNQKISTDTITDAQETVLITFCNQNSSPFHSLLVTNLSNRDARWIDLSSIPEMYRESFAGVCGACSVGNQIVIATQGAKPILAIVDLEAAKISSYVPMAKCKDTHSVVFHDGYLYAVSTGTNEIYRVPLQDQMLGAEELYWQYPGVEYDRDEIHLNGLTIDSGRFIASCFGEKGEDGSWSSNGKVFYLDMGLVIHENLLHPHTPVVIGDHLFFAESAAHKVYAYKRPTLGGWALDKEIQLDGYTRGIMFRNGFLLVCLSASRKNSRSKKIVNTNFLPSSSAAIIAVDMATDKHKKVADLVNYGREIYDILPMANRLAIGAIRSESDAVMSRVMEMESTVDRYAVDLGSLWLQVNNQQKMLSAKIHELEQLQKTNEEARLAAYAAGLKEKNNQKINVMRIVRFLKRIFLSNRQ